jgi:hypothetical protein
MAGISRFEPPFLVGDINMEAPSDIPVVPFESWVLNTLIEISFLFL